MWGVSRIDQCLMYSFVFAFTCLAHNVLSVVLSRHGTSYRLDSVLFTRSLSGASMMSIFPPSGSYVVYRACINMYRSGQKANQKEFSHCPARRDEAQRHAHSRQYKFA